jgi:hypothetical protein
MAEKPNYFKSFKGADIVATFNGQVIGTLQSLKMDEIRSTGSYVPRPFYNHPVQVSILDESTVPIDFHNEYMAQWSPGMDDPRQRSIRTRTETIECAYPRIFHMIEDQMHHYQEQFRRRPQYFSLNRAAYRSFWLQFRHGEMRESHMMNPETFIGIDVICNPNQDVPVMALGKAYEEGIEGRLDYE